MMLGNSHSVNSFPDACADPEGGGQGVRTPPPPLENYKNIGFLSNTGPDPLKMKKVNKQCLLDTPRTVRVSEKTWQVIVRTRRP